MKKGEDGEVSLKCINCHGEIPDESELCLRCGARQTPRVNRREPLPANKPSRQRNLSLLAVFAVIIIVVVSFFIISYSRENTMKERFETLSDTFERGNLDLLTIQVSQFLDSYPGSELAGKATELLEELKAEKSKPAVLPDDLAEFYEKLDADPAGNILKVESVNFERVDALGYYNVTLDWQYNLSERVKYIGFIVEGYDADGNSVVCQEKSESKVLLESADLNKKRGETLRSEFINVWKADGIASVKLLQVNVTFDNGLDYIISPNNISKIF